MKRCIVTILLGLSLIATPSAQSYLSVYGDARPQITEKYDRNKRYIARLRDFRTGEVIASTYLDAERTFLLNPVEPGDYILELINPKHKIVCTEGPFTVEKTNPYIIVDCARPVAAWWLVGAAVAAGLTSGIVASWSPASPSR